MTHHQKCSSCGARNTIPKTGLTVTCEYCGFERPVPDVEKRRKQMEKAEARRRKQEEAKRKAAEREAHHKQMKKRASVGRLVALLLTVVPIIVVGFVLHSRGTLETVISQVMASFGQNAQQHFDNEADRLRGEGYLQQSPAKAEHGIGSIGSPVSLTPGFCYALVVGSDSPIKRIELRGPEPATTSAGRIDRYQATLRHCPGKNSLSHVRVHLDDPTTSTYVWSLYSKPMKVTKKPTAKTRPTMRVTRSARKHRGMKSYSSRASRSKPARRPKRKQPPQPQKSGPSDPTASDDDLNTNTDIDEFQH